MSQRGKTNQHEWGWQGFDKDGRQYAYCPLCDTWTRNSVKIKKSEVPARYYEPDSQEHPLL